MVLLGVGTCQPRTTDVSTSDGHNQVFARLLGPALLHVQMVVLHPALHFMVTHSRLTRDSLSRSQSWHCGIPSPLGVTEAARGTIARPP